VEITTLGRSEVQGPTSRGPDHPKKHSNAYETSRQEKGTDDNHIETMTMPHDHDLGRPSKVSTQ